MQIHQVNLLKLWSKFKTVQMPWPSAENSVDIIAQKNCRFIFFSKTHFSESTQPKEAAFPAIQSLYPWNSSVFFVHHSVPNNLIYSLLFCKDLHLACPLEIGASCGLGWPNYTSDFISEVLQYSYL